MAKRSKLAFNFDEMAGLAEKLEKAGGNLQAAADRALKATHDYITPNLSAGIQRHVQTGDTKESLDKQGGVVWESPLKAHINIGFNLKEGGLPSIFLMWGTPKMRPDTKLKSAAFGAKVTREVAAIQRQEMEKALQEITRG